MTAYFDSKNELIKKSKEVKEVGRIEADVLADVTIVLSHKKLPIKNADQIRAIIEENRIVNDDGSPGPGREWWDITRTSQLLRNLHLAFHRHAHDSEGVWSDSPNDIVISMKRRRTNR